MKIHEYQAKELLHAYGAPVPTGTVVTTARAAAYAAEYYCSGKGGKCVIKAQVHSGGRGKAGGVKLAASPEEAREIGETMLGSRLYTHQAGPEGKLVSKLLVTEAVAVEKEFYLSITADNEHACLAVVASADGGTEIEETAKEHPERILTVLIPVGNTLRGNMVSGDRSGGKAGRPDAARGTTADRPEWIVSRIGGVCVKTGDIQNAAGKVSQCFGLTEENARALEDLLCAMVKLYIDRDCSLVEINPLALTDKGKLLCLDAKVNFDDNALFRHPENEKLRDISEEDPAEYEAAQSALSYVKLDGSIGCLVNGAGLAMATMDILKRFGGEPANFLDVGGSATAERVKRAFEIVLSDPKVKAIFVNIFGGIMKCDVIAEGITKAAKEMDLRVPLIVRLEGTNVERGKEILGSSGLAIIAAEDMADGARKAVQAAAV